MQFSFGQMQFSGGTAFPWYLQGAIGGVNPNLWWNWLNARYAIKQSSKTFNEAQTFTRDSAAAWISASGSKLDFLPNEERIVVNSTQGLLIELTRANLFVNPNVPATQNITTTAIPYTLSFYGTGSIVLSGTHSATLAGTGTDRVNLTFTPSAGTLTLTLSGTITYPNFEAGSFPTSYIQGD